MTTYETEFQKPNCTVHRIGGRRYDWGGVPDRIRRGVFYGVRPFGRRPPAGEGRSA